MRNPKEFFWVNGKKTFAVMNELVSPECIDGSEPLSMHHETFSRFHFVLFNENRKAVTANIPASQMPGIFSAVETRKIAQQVATVISPTASETTSPTAAFTVSIRSGKLKGMTPAAALIENPDTNKTLLENQIQWLKTNLTRYPKNQEQIKAIEEALHLYASNKLSEVGLKPVAGKTVIYPGGLRPLVRKKKANGKAFVYMISVNMYDQGDRPIEVTVRNFYAPVITTEQGLYNVKVKQKEDDLSVTCDFSMFEWEWFRHQAEAQMRTFENIWAPTLYKTAIAAEQENRKQFEYSRKQHGGA